MQNRILTIIVIAVLLFEYAGVSYELAFGYQPESLSSILDEERNDLTQNQNDTRLYAEAVKNWIEVIEQELKLNPQDPSFEFAAMELVDLYKQDGRLESAKILLEQMVDSPFVLPNVRLESALNAAKIASEIGQSADQIITDTDKYITLINYFRKHEIDYTQNGTDISYDEKYRDINLLRFQFLHGSAQRVEANANGSPQEIANRATPLFHQAGEYLNQYINKRSKGTTSEIYDKFGGVPTLLYQLGQLHVEEAAAYEKSGNKDMANQAHLDAVKTLERIFTEYPRTREFEPSVSDNAAMLLLSQKFLIKKSIEDFVNYAYEITNLVAPMQGLPGYLANMAGKLENQEPQNDPNLLAAAIALYELAMKLEEKAAPAEYKKHPNYQSALIFAAQDSMKIGDYDQAGIYINKLDHLYIVGDFENGWFKDLKSNYNKYENSPAIDQTPIQVDEAEEPPANHEEIHDTNQSVSPEPSQNITPINPLPRKKTTPTNLAPRKSSEISWLLPTGVGAGIIFIIIILMAIRKSKFA